MAHLIDKDALVAEIKRQLDCCYKICAGNLDFLQKSYPEHYYSIETYKEILSFIDTLEVKEVQEEPVSEDLEKASKEWLTPQLDKSYAAYGDAKMMELTKFDGYAMLDAIEFGAKWQFEKVNEALLSEVLPCFMHGGEADEVVAKLDEVLNKKNK